MSSDVGLPRSSLSSVTEVMSLTWVLRLVVHAPPPTTPTPVLHGRVDDVLIAKGVSHVGVAQAVNVARLASTARVSLGLGHPVTPGPPHTGGGM